MDPDVHDTRLQQHNAPSPSAIQAILAAAAAQTDVSDELKPASSFLASPSLREVIHHALL
jgi:hypothetical protein